MRCRIMQSDSSANVFQYVLQPWDNIPLLAQKFNTSVKAILEANPGIYLNCLFVGQILYIPMESLVTNCISNAALNLLNHMRLLWEQHVYWTRMTIMSLVFPLADVNFVIPRLLQNATDMGNALIPYYGEQTATIYESLIREHLLIAADLVKAAIKGDANELAELDKKWTTNADQIAHFLSSISPYLPENEVKEMFYEHLALTKAEAVSMINKDYQTSITIFDQIETQGLEMADMISYAIIRQFPNHF